MEEVTTLLLCLAMMVWLHYQQTVEEQTWKGFSTEALKSWGLYFQVRRNTGGRKGHITLAHGSCTFHDLGDGQTA